MDFSNYKKFYRSVGSVKCPYFGNESIFFTMKGFKHLLYKEGRRRLFSDQIRRLRLLVYCKTILGGDYIKVEASIDKGLDGFARFWAFDANIDGKKIRLIVRKINNGSRQFFSIFPL